MAARKEFTELKQIIDRNVNNDRVLWGEFLNQLFNYFVASFVFRFEVASTAERNALVDKFAGMLVLVKNDALYVLEDDLITWSKIVKNAYTQSEVDDLLALKIDAEPSRGLSEQDFTLSLLNKLNAIEDGATKIAQLSDAPWLETIVDDILDSIADLEAATLVAKKTTQTITSDITLDEFMHTILIDASSDPIIITLPNANKPEFEGRIYILKRIDESGNLVKIIPYDYDFSASAGQEIEFDQHLYVDNRNAIQIEESNGHWYKIN